MSPPSNEPDSGIPPLSRRSFFAIAGVLAAASALATDIANPLSASAAVAWGYPFTAPSPISDYFGTRGGAHKGVDFDPGAGTPIYAIADGQIIISGVTGTDGAYGESIWIQHADGYRSIYAHMEVGTRIPVGRVTRGQYIGKVGNTGHSYGAHLHLEIHRNNTPINPLPFVQNAPLPGQDPQMTPEQAALLAQIAADVQWIKDRIGGTLSSPNLSSEFAFLKNRVGGDGSTPNITQDMTWLKTRVGGSGTSPSITDQLRAIQGV